MDMDCLSKLGHLELSDNLLYRSNNTDNEDEWTTTSYGSNSNGQSSTSFVQFHEAANTSEDTIDFEMNRYSHRLSYLYGTLPLIFFCIVSIAINIKILLSVHWIRRPLSPTLHISLSLAGADVFTSTALAIGLVMNSFIPVGLGIELSGLGCFLLGLEATRLGGVIITVGHLVALAVNHYLGILRPLHYISIMTHRITTLLTILIWTLPLSFFFAYFSLVDSEGFRSEQCETNTFLLKNKFRLMFGSLFFGPFLIMVSIYAHIFCIVRKHQASRLRFSRAASSFRRGDSTDRQEHSASQQMARNVKAIQTTLFILGSFVVGWMPATFLYVLVCEDCLLKFDWITGNAKFLVYYAFNCLIILKTLANPIIYAARMHEIQVASRRMNSSLCGFLKVINYSEKRTRTTVDCSEGPTTSRRGSLSMSATCRLTNNTGNNHKNMRNYTYTGMKRYSRNHTVV